MGALRAHVLDVLVLTRVTFYLGWFYNVVAFLADLVQAQLPDMLHQLVMVDLQLAPEWAAHFDAVQIGEVTGSQPHLFLVADGALFIL